MAILGKLWGRKNRGTQRQSFQERDNRGTRQDSPSAANEFWTLRMYSTNKPPFLLYVFPCEQDAREALLELPYLHTAEDTGKLICTEALDFGCYPGDDGQYESVICGDDLTHELWEQAKASFIRHGGKPKGTGELEPPRGFGLRSSGNPDSRESSSSRKRRTRAE